MKKINFTILACTFLMVSVFTPTLAEQPKVSVVIPGGIMLAPYFYADAFGLFKDVGFKLKNHYVSTGGEVIQLFTAGDADIAVTSAGPAGVTIGKGVPAKMIRPFINGGFEIIAVKKDIKTPADAKGKIVAVSGIGSGTETVGRILMEQAGIDTHKDCKVQVMRGPDMVAAARLGHIDIAFTWPPHAQRMLTDIPDAHRLMDTVAKWKEYFNINVAWPFHGLVVKTKLLEKYPDQIMRMDKALQLAAKKLKAMPIDEKAQFLSKYTRQKPAVVKMALEEGNVIYNSHPLSKDDIKSCEIFWKYMYKWGYMKFQMNAEKAFWKMK